MNPYIRILSDKKLLQSVLIIMLIIIQNDPACVILNIDDEFITYGKEPVK